MGLGKGIVLGALGALGAVFAAATISVLIEDKRNKELSDIDSNDDLDADNVTDASAKTQIQVVVTGRSKFDTARIISLLNGTEYSEDNEITFKETLFSSECTAENCSVIKSNLLNSNSVIYCISAEDQNFEDITAVNTLTANGIKVIAVITGIDAVSKEQMDSVKRTVAENFSDSESVIVIIESDDCGSKIINAVTLEE